MIRAALTFVRVLIGRLKQCEVTIGVGTFIASGVFFSSNRAVSIGNRVYIGRNSSLSCHLTIGNDVLIASNVSFVGGDHKIDNIDCMIRDSGRDVIKPILIKSNVWVGHGAIILHGVKIEEGAVVAAGSVVTKNVEKNAIVAGNPAKFLRYRKFNKTQM